MHDDSALAPRAQLLVAHAPLGEVEWPGTVKHIGRTMPPYVPFVLSPGASGKALLERIKERGMFPSSTARWCTSDFKRTPIEREFRRYLKAHPCLYHKRALSDPPRAPPSGAKGRPVNRGPAVRRRRWNFGATRLIASQIPQSSETACTTMMPGVEDP